MIISDVNIVELIEALKTLRVKSTKKVAPLIIRPFITNGEKRVTLGFGPHCEEIFIKGGK